MYRPAAGCPVDIWKTLTPAEKSKLKYREKHPIARCPRPHGHSEEEWNKLNAVERQRVFSMLYYHDHVETWRNAGGVPTRKFCQRLINSMIACSKHRGHDPPEFKLDDLLKLSNEYNRYVVDEHRGFDVVWSNGFYNSASCQRIDDSIGYVKTNVVIYPYMLNTRIAFRHEDLFRFTQLIVSEPSDEIKSQWINHGTFFSLYAAMKRRCDQSGYRKYEFGFDDSFDCMVYMKELFIKQGGCCAYSGAPLYLAHNSPFTASIERLDPIKGYTKENVVFICAALNSSINGFHRSCTSSNKDEYGSERHIQELEKSKFNIEYWERSMNITAEIKGQVETNRISNQEFLRRALFGDLKPIQALYPKNLNYLNATITIRPLETNDCVTFKTRKELADFLGLNENNDNLFSFVCGVLPVLHNFIVVESDYPKGPPPKFNFNIRAYDTKQKRHVQFDNFHDSYVYLAENKLISTFRDRPISRVLTTFKRFQDNPNMKMYKRFKMIDEGIDSTSD